MRWEVFGIAISSLAAFFIWRYFKKLGTDTNTCCQSSDTRISKNVPEGYLFYLNQEQNFLYISTEKIDISDFQQVYTYNSPISSERFTISHLKLNKCTLNAEFKAMVESLKLKCTKLTVENLYLTLSQIENLIELFPDVKTLHLNGCNVLSTSYAFIMCISGVNVPEVHLSNLTFSGNSSFSVSRSILPAGGSKPLSKHLTVDKNFITNDSHSFHIQCMPNSDPIKSFSNLLSHFEDFSHLTIISNDVPFSDLPKEHSLVKVTIDSKDKISYHYERKLQSKYEKLKHFTLTCDKLSYDLLTSCNLVEINVDSLKEEIGFDFLIEKSKELLKITFYGTFSHSVLYELQSILKDSSQMTFTVNSWKSEDANLDEIVGKVNINDLVINFDFSTEDVKIAQNFCSIFKFFTFKNLTLSNTSEAVGNSFKSIMETFQNMNIKGIENFYIASTLSTEDFIHCLKYLPNTDYFELTYFENEIVDMNLLASIKDILINNKHIKLIIPKDKEFTLSMASVIKTLSDSQFFGPFSIQFPYSLNISLKLNNSWQFHSYKITNGGNDITKSSLKREQSSPYEPYVSYELGGFEDEQSNWYLSLEELQKEVIFKYLRPCVPGRA